MRTRSKYSDRVAAQLWQLYQEHKSFRAVAQITGRSHQNIRYHIQAAGYDIDEVERPPTHTTTVAKVAIGGRVDARDASLLQSLPEGTSYHLYEAVRQYCDRLRLKSL